VRREKRKKEKKEPQTHKFVRDILVSGHGCSMEIFEIVKLTFDYGD